jgi:hypothetical protein
LLAVCSVVLKVEKLAEYSVVCLAELKAGLLDSEKVEMLAVLMAVLSVDSMVVYSVAKTVLILIGHNI